LLALARTSGFSRFGSRAGRYTFRRTANKIEVPRQRRWASSSPATLGQWIDLSSPGQELANLRSVGDVGLMAFSITSYKNKLCGGDWLWAAF
jgi:hypothetical protein